MPDGLVAALGAREQVCCSLRPPGWSTGMTVIPLEIAFFFHAIL
jgi:hypothetical protein